MDLWWYIWVSVVVLLSVCGDIFGCLWCPISLLKFLVCGGTFGCLWCPFSKFMICGGTFVCLWWYIWVSVVVYLSTCVTNT